MMIEIIGLAGSGKSTLADALCECDERVVAGKRFVPTALENIPFCARQFLWWLPPIVRYAPGRKPLSRREFKRMIYLNGWHRVLQRHASTKDAVMILDQGPVFKLAKLHAFGPDWLKSQGFADWWDRMFKQWAAVLDTVVWLDAPHDVLLERIHVRDAWHAVKDKSESEATHFLSIYQLACEHVVSRLEANKRIRILRFDSSRQTPEQIAGDVLAALDLS